MWNCKAFPWQTGQDWLGSAGVPVVGSRINCASVDEPYFYDAVLEIMQGHIVVFQNGSKTSSFKFLTCAGHLLPHHIEFGEDKIMVVFIHSYR